MSECTLLTLIEAMQRRLALCSHHASSGALLLLREQSRGQSRGQAGALGMTLLVSGGSTELMKDSSRSAKGGQQLTETVIKWQHDQTLFTQA